MKNFFILFVLLLEFTNLEAKQKNKKEDPNEKAKSALQLIRKGMTVAGVEELFKTKEPKKISKTLTMDLKEALPPRHVVWTLADIQWKAPWSEIFTEPTGTIVQAYQMDAPLNKKDIKTAEGLLKTAKQDSSERARLLWTVAHHYALQNQPAKAGPLLEELLKSKQTLIESDLIVMTVARMYFQINQLEKAITHYNMIDKSSDYWVESVEEKAWAYFRKGDYDHVQSDMKTLMHPMFVNQVGPEPFFLDGFAKLKVCDYPGIFKVIKDFKELHKDRILRMEALAGSGIHPSVELGLKAMADGPSTFQEVGKVSADLPRFFYRDWELARLGMKKAIYTRQSVDAKPDSTDEKIKKRIQALAKAELDEAKKILNKFHILEAEAIQRMHIQDRKNTKEIQHQNIADDEIEFPVSDDEVWVDEVDKFQVLSRGCPDKKQEKTL